jgi:hypothetical protein
MRLHGTIFQKASMYIIKFFYGQLIAVNAWLILSLAVWLIKTVYKQSSEMYVVGSWLIGRLVS